MRLPTVLTTAAVSSLATLAVTGLVSYTARVRHARTHECRLDDTDYPHGHLILHNIDGSHTGLCTAALSEHFDTEDVPTPLDPASYAALYQQFTDASMRASSAVDHFDYEDMLRSAVEVIFVLAINIAQAKIGGDHDCDGQECEGIDMELVMPTAASLLIEVAMNYEMVHESHLDACRTCRKAGDDAPGLLRAGFCRDIADDILTNSEEVNVQVRGVPLAAAFDVACGLMSTIHEAWGDSPKSQIRDLTSGVAMAIAHSEGHGFHGAA